jgi:hypothetical protein
MSPNEHSTSNVVRTLWHGSPLSIFEELSLRSFVACGHEVEVYAYEPIEVPAGVRWVDANSILPSSQVFAYTNGPALGSFAAFSNWFRFKLLYEKGGIYSDADVLCLRPLHDLPDAWIGEVSPNYVNGAIMKFPAGHSVCGEVSDRLRELGDGLYLGQTGELLTKLICVERGGDSCTVLPVDAFYPIAWVDMWKILDPDALTACEHAVDRSYCLHWWNTAITFGVGMPKQALPPPGSYLFERAVAVLDRPSIPAWPAETTRVWLENFKESQLLKTYREHGRLALADQFDGVRQSIGWMVLQGCWQAIDVLLPQGSRRRAKYETFITRLRGRLHRAGPEHDSSSVP